MAGFWRTLIRGPEVEQRSLERVTDIGIAFQDRIAELTVTQDSAIPSVFRSMQLLADLVASLSLERVSPDLPPDPDYPLFKRPNPNETYQTTMHKIMASLLYRGNAYLWVTRDFDGEVSTIMVLNPDEVSVTPDQKNLYPEYQWRGKSLTRNREIYHIPLNLRPGHFVGLSPIQATRSLYDGIIAEQNMARRLFEDNATPSGTLTIPAKLSKPEIEAIKDSWIDSHGGRKHPAVLSGGAKFDQITLSPVDAQFIEQREFGVLEIARMFGLHPWFLGSSDGSSLTYATTESLFRTLVVNTLNPTYLERIASTFTDMLPNGEYAQFNTDELLKADLKSRYDSYKVGLDAGFLDVEDVRKLEGLELRSVNSVKQTSEVV